MSEFRKASLTEEQLDRFCQMLHEAILEIRNLTAVGFCKQANALADAFHNLPVSLFDPNFDWGRARMHIGGYQKKYPRIVEDNIVSGSYNDYLSILDEIENLEK